MFETKEEESNLKLTDFGFATLLTQDKFRLEKGVLLGTPWYISPEVLLRQQYSPACDVWSLGESIKHLMYSFHQAGRQSSVSIESC